MALIKETVTFNFNQGMDSFIDPNQLPIGKFQSLQNSVFVQSGGQGKLQVRNGYQNLTALDSQSSYISTYSNGLVSLSNTTFKAYSQGLNQWKSISPITPLQLSVNPLIRNAYSQIGFDMSIQGGLACVTYLENATFGSGSATLKQKYAVLDVKTGQPVVVPTTITSTVGTVSQTAISRVFSLGSQFAIFSGVPNQNVSSGSFGAIQYFTINQTSLSVSAPQVFTRAYSTQVVGTASMNNSFDGVVSSNSLYFSWYAGSASGRSGILTTNFTTNFTQGTTSALTQSNGAVSALSVCSDNIGPSPSRIWNTYISWDSTNSALTNVGIAVSDYNLNFISSVNAYSQSHLFLLANQYSQVTSFAVNGTMTFFLEAVDRWTTNSSRRLDSVYKQQTGLNFVEYSAALNIATINNIGIASKPVAIGSDSYWLSSFNSIYQSTYFLINSANSFISKLSYGNGGGFYNTDVPQIQSIGSSLFVGYLNKELISNVNKNTNVSSQTQTAGIYAQTGINVSQFNFTPNAVNTIETANNLHFGGGLLYHFDGQVLDELNFNVYPDWIDANSSNQTLSGNMTQQSYFYVSVYEYTDNKGNIIRSAPSIPINVTIASGSATAVTVSSPTCQATLKNQSAIRVTFYRWSTNQQTYYQVTSQTAPLTNVDQYGNTLNYVSFVDKNSDAQILGNNILYTNGGVVEDDGPPAANAITMFDDRMWLINAEDPNLLLYSKEILEGTPVEFSQLLTYFVPPTTATGAPTGPVRSFAPMDDKLILFKDQTVYYINGTGPNDTGTQNQYSPTPVFVTSGVGCSNQNSIVLTPPGLMFQSGTKGIWLLKRDLSIQYIGKDVIQYSSNNVKSAVLVPNTNHVKFTLDNGITLLFDYLVEQWGVDTNNGQSACVYNGYHTYLTNTGSVYQENPGSYVDGQTPVTMTWQTGWLNLAGLQGYARAYWMQILSNFQSGHTYTMGIAYDYNPLITQTATITPTNTIGSGSQVEQWQVNFKYDQCQSFQLTFTEISSGIAGAGLTMSGISLTYGKKKTFARNIPATNRIG